MDNAAGQDGATRAKGGPVIEIDHVTKRFADYVAVSDADFSIASGEFFSMLGPSGCGKTTTLRMIAGFETPTEGAIRLEGADVSRVPPHKRNVNTVFQHYALFPHMTVWDNVAYGPRSKKKDKAEVRKRVDELLEIVRLTDFAERKPAQLSGGQQQRVALARALVNYPSALLLDEPLGALDLKLRQVMQFELKRIQREVGITFIYVTHDQEEALTMSDRIAVMNAGNVEQIGTPTEIYDRPSTVFVASFIGQANLWAGRQTGRSQSRFRRNRSARNDFEGSARRHHHRARRPGHADGAARSGSASRWMRRAVTSRRYGPRCGPDVPGPCGATVAGRRRRLDDRRPRRRRAGPAAAAPGRRGPRQLVARRLAGAARRGHPDYRGSRGDARRLLTAAPLTSIPSPIHERHSRHAPNEIDPRLLARLATNRTVAPAIHRRRRRGRRGAGARRVRSSPRAGRTDSSPPRRRPHRTTAGPPAARCGSRTGRCTWPTVSSPAFQKASGITVDYKEDFNDNEQWFAKVKEPLSRKQDIGADLAVPTSSWPRALEGLGWLNEISDPGVPNKKNLRPDLLEAKRRSRAASSPRRT